MRCLRKTEKSVGKTKRHVRGVRKSEMYEKK